MQDADASTPRRAELDYAFLAQWAGIQPDGTLTAVGMSFLRVAQGGVLSMAVAGRVRLYDETPESHIGITVRGSGTTAMAFTDRLTPGQDAATRYGTDRHQVLFVLNTQVSVAELGMYSVDVSLDGTLARTLMFEVVVRPSGV